MNNKIQFNKYSKLFMSTSLLITATAIPATTGFAQSKFVDVSGNIHESAIHALVDRDLLKGFPNGLFKPYENLTRGQVVIIIGRFLVEKEGLAIPSDYASNMRFNDLHSNMNDELLRYAALVKDVGIFNGSSGDLNVNDFITREQNALVVMRLLDYYFDINSIAYINSQSNTDLNIVDLDQASRDAQKAIEVLKYFNTSVD